MEELKGSSNKTNESGIIGEFTKGCLNEYNVVACSRDILESVFAVITIVLCTVKVVKLHLARHEIWNQYLIFYAAIIEILLLTIDWIYLHHASVDLVAELLKLFQFLVVCRFYCKIASRISKREYLYKRICIPFLVITFTYYTALIIASIIQMRKKNECQEPEWLQLSCSEVALGIIFMVMGIYITTHINSLRTDVSHKRNIRRSLWGIILSFEVSAIVSATYDVVMIVYGEVYECRGIFVYDAALFTVSHVLVKLIKWLLPIWAMIIIFKPDTFRGNKSGDDVFDDDQPPIIRNSLIQDFKSEFRPRNRSFNYKHLRDPENEEERRILQDQNAESRKLNKGSNNRKRNDTSKSSGNSSVFSPEENESNKKMKLMASKKTEKDNKTEEEILTNNAINTNPGDIVDMPVKI